jgi:hypothetical protein
MTTTDSCLNDFELGVLRFPPLQRSRAPEAFAEKGGKLSESRPSVLFKAGRVFDAAAKTPARGKSDDRRTWVAGVDFFGSFFSHQRKNILKTGSGSRINEFIFY